MHRIFSIILSAFIKLFAIGSIFLLFSSCIMFNVIMIKHIEIVKNNIVIFIHDIEYSVKNGNFTLGLTNITLQNIHNRESVALPNIYLTAKTYKIYRNFFSAERQRMFTVQINNIDANNIMRFLFKQNKNVSREFYFNERDREIILSNILIFLNKKYLNNFKVELFFKSWNFQDIANNIQIKKVIFNSSASKDYLGQFTIDYEINSQSNVLTGLIFRELQNKKNILSEILYDMQTHTHFVIEFYGYTKANVDIQKNTLHSDGFIKLKASYDIKNNDVYLHNNIESLRVESSHQVLLLNDLVLEGRYTDKALLIKNFTFNLCFEKEKFPFSGNLNFVYNKFFELFIQSHQAINTNTVFKHWPIYGQKVKTKLENLVQSGVVENANFFLKILLQNEKYSILDLHSNFTVRNALLKQNIYNQYYNMTSDVIDVMIDLQGTQIMSKKAFIDQIHVNDIRVFIPFRSHETKSEFEIISSAQNIQKYLKKFTSETELLQGDIIAKVNLIVPHNLKNNDLYMNGLLNLKNINFRYKNQKNVLNAKDFHFTFKNKEIFTRGNVEYNKVLLEQLKLRGKFDNINIESVQLSLNQKLIQNKLYSLNINANGNLLIHQQNKNSFIFDLNDVEIKHNIDSFKKFIGEAASIKFDFSTSKNTYSFNNINLNFPLLVMNGDIKVYHDTSTVQEMNILFEKFLNSKFKLQYDNNNDQHIYTITADIIDIADIERIIQEFKESQESGVAEKRVYIVRIDCNLVKLSSKDILKNLKISFFIQNGVVEKIDGEAYSTTQYGYFRLFLDKPVIALIINNSGNILKNSFDYSSLQGGNLSIYGFIENNYSLNGDLYLNEFQLLESYFLSTIARIYALSGFSIKNVFKLGNNGINFSDMHCHLKFSDDIMTLNACQAFSDAMLLSLDATINIKDNSGDIEGMVIPKSFFNTPIIFLQRFLGRKGETLLDAFKGHQNFSIIWKKNEKPVIKTNPVSFLLPSVFTYIFSQKKTLNK